jgi:hypothetical protein
VRAKLSAVRRSRLLVASAKIRILGRLSTARDGEALFLTAGKADAVLADCGVVALGQLLDDVVDLGELARPHDVVEAAIGARRD